MYARRTFPRPILFLFLIVLLAVTCLISQGPADHQLSATYSQGLVHVTIPYQAPRAGSGKLSVEVLDPEDRVIGRVERAADAGSGKGVWREDVSLAKPIAIDDLVWHRLHYRFSYSGSQDAIAEDTESISQILRMPVLRIIGQQSYFAGGDASVRVIATDSKNQPVEGSSRVRVELIVPGQQSRQLFAGPLNRRGTAEAQFRMPSGMVGSFPLRYTVDTPIGSAEFTETVRLEETAAILLTTEKPIYQPGQTIHARALALDRANHQASANRPLTFEWEDSRGNKVFRKTTQTDAFGVASADFTLADEVNLGAYHLRANGAEITVNVDRYVLPKFKVAVDLASDGAPRHGYRPGDHVTGTVRADYFFGKPVDHAEVSIKALGMDVAQFEAGSIAGKTDATGAYRFDLPLPAYFAGRPLSQGAARALIEATVKDAAGHAETRGEPVVVSQSPLLITAIPEGGMLVPNIENQVFILTSYADGKPAPADLTVSAPELPNQHLTSDAGGVAVVRMNPGSAAQSLRIEARDHDGNQTTANTLLDARRGAEQILVRPDRAVYRPGDRIALKMFSSRQMGAAYLDIVREGQTLLTRDVDLVNGQAEFSLTATPAMAGTLDLNAYVIGRDSRPVADHRLVFVQPADELKIEATADAQSYKPGADARVRFRVTNSRGEGVQAALGVQVVDEAVFALAEKQPGFAKVFFYLEQEAMKPRYEIHSIGMPEVVQPATRAQADQRDHAAQALFAATELVHKNSVDREVGRSIPNAQYGAYRVKYAARFETQVKALCEDLSRPNVMRSPDDLTHALETLSRNKTPAARDFWGTELRVERMSWGSERTYLLRSAGPDKQFNTADDLTRYIEARPGESEAPVVTAAAVKVFPAPLGMIGRGMGGGFGFGGGGGGVAGGVLGGIVGGVPTAAAPPANDVGVGRSQQLRSQWLRRDRPRRRRPWRFLYDSRPLLFPRSSLHQSRNHHRRLRFRNRLHPPG